MASDVGAIDGLLRIVAGLIKILPVFAGPQMAWGWIGLVPLLTGPVSRCAAYRLVGVRTCKNP